MKFLRNTSALVSLLGLVFVGLYILAALLPQPWWGLHFIAFLPIALQITFFGLAIAAIASLYFFRKKLNLNQVDPKGAKYVVMVIVSVLCGLAYYNFPLHSSLYGDSEVFRKKMGERTTQNYDVFTESLLSPNVLHPKIGNLTVLSAVRLISYHFNTTHQQAYRCIGAVSGIIFLLLWFLFINWYIENRQLKLILYLMGITAPYTQFFFGYEEIYAPAFPISAAYLMAVLAYFKSQKSWWLWLLPFLLFLCLKIHAVFILLLPSLALTFAYHFIKNKPLISYFNWKWASICLLIPFFTFGAVVYFFILKDYNDPRFVNDDVNIYERLFLPLIPPAPPYDRYTLLHYNHFFDYFNMIFLWSASALFILVAAILFFRKKINWNKPELLVIGFTMLLFLTIYFAYNPLMSMPVDFDLFSLPATTFLLLAAVIVSQLGSQEIEKKITGPIIALCLLTLPIFIVNANGKMLGERVENVGIYVFKTYWIKSSEYIRNGIVLQDYTPQSQINRYQEILGELEPYAVEGDDVEYAYLVLDVAKIYRTQLKDFNTALSYHQRVLRYYQNSGACYVGLMESAFYLKKYDLAYKYCQGLLKYNYPSPEKALELTIYCAVMTNRYDIALAHCSNYLSNWTSNDIARIRETLLSGKGIEELKLEIENK